MPEPASSSRATRTVFIADDDCALRALLRLLIQSEPGFRVAGEAGTAHAAIEMIGVDGPPDILLVDVNMPERGEACKLRELRERSPAMQVVVYSGEDELDGRRRMGDIGYYDYVVKGRPEQLLAALRTVSAQLEAQRGA